MSQSIDCGVKFATDSGSLTWGADPEFFLKETNKRGEFVRWVPAGEVIGGTKEKGIPLKNGASYHVDGLALELTTKTYKNVRGLQNHIYHSIQTLNTDVLPPEVSISFHHAVAVKDFHRTKLKKEWLEVGCSPAYIFRNGEVSNITATRREIEESGFYTAGGHIHMGWVTDGIVNAEDPDYIHACGVFSSLVSRSWEFYMGRPRRLSPVYGNTSSYRAKPYGIEFRAPSNKWCRRRSDPYHELPYTIKNLEYSYDRYRTIHMNKYGE